MLLHNVYMSTPLSLAHPVQLKKEYCNAKILLQDLNYEEYPLDVIRSFKMLTFLMNLQGDFIKFSYYICFWNQLMTAKQYQE